jgi:hypothetical protein
MKNLNTKPGQPERKVFVGNFTEEEVEETLFNYLVKEYNEKLHNFKRRINEARARNKIGV